MLSSCRKWQLTLNNPVEKGFDHSKIKAALAEIKPILYWCLADEIGEQGTPHTHIYLCSSSAIKFTRIKHLFSEAHLEAVRGTSQENRDYITKSGKWENDEKHETSVPNSFEEWGEIPIEQQGERTDLEALYGMIKDGLSNFEILESNPQFMLRINDIERARLTVRMEQFRKQFRKLDVSYLWGPTGVGKTRTVMEKYHYENIFRITNYKNPFDNYSGEFTVLFDEFHSQITVPLLLNLLDGYPLELPARYANKIACYTHVFIISNIDLLEQYRDVQKTQPETWAAILRRINHVIKFLPDGQFREYATDEYVNGYVEMSSQDLPFDDVPPDTQPAVDTGSQMRLREEPNWSELVNQEGTAKADDRKQQAGRPL